MTILRLMLRREFALMLGSAGCWPKSCERNSVASSFVLVRAEGGRLLEKFRRAESVALGGLLKRRSPATWPGFPRFPRSPESDDAILRVRKRQISDPFQLMG